MNNDQALSRQLETMIGLLRDLIVLEALKAGISGSAIRSFLGVDMNRVTQVTKMMKTARKR